MKKLVVAVLALAMVASVVSIAIAADEIQSGSQTILPILNPEIMKKETVSMLPDGIVDLTTVPLVKQSAAAPEGEPRDRELITIYELDMLSHAMTGNGYREPAGLGLIYLLSEAEEGFEVQNGITRAQWVTLAAADSVLPSGERGVILRTKAGELIEISKEEFESRSGLVTEIQNKNGETERVIVTDISVVSRTHFLGIGAYVEYIDSSGQVNRVSPIRFIGLWNGSISAPDSTITLIRAELEEIMKNINFQNNM